MKLFEIESRPDVSKTAYLFNELKYEWNEYIKWNYRTIIPEIAGNIGKFQIKYIYDKNHLMYGLYDLKNKQYIGFLSLFEFKQNAKNVFQIDRAGLKTSYTDMGLMLKLYTWIITKQNIILVSGSSQSMGGRKLWETLGKQKGIFIFGYNKDTKESFQIDQDDIFGEHMYSDDVDNEISYLEKEWDALMPKFPGNFRTGEEWKEKRVVQIEKEIESLRKYQTEKGGWSEAKHLVLVAMKSKK